MPRAGPTRHHLGSRRAEVAGMVVRVKVNGNWGECGSSSVWLDGTLVCSCLVLAAQAHEREVRTVEGVTASDRLHPIQQAFVEAGAVQCGFCTPGFVVAVADLLQKDPTPSPATVREALSGNLCRCTGYEKILDAVSLASSRLGDGK